jgi:hypothetical protein
VDASGDYTYIPQLNDHIDYIRGIIDYSYDQYEIEVSFDEDIGPVTTGVEEVSGQVPVEYSLSQNYPNPFNPVTQITYTVPSDANLRIEIFNVLGQKVRTLVDERVRAGSHVVTWRGRDDTGLEVASGIYFCRFASGDFVRTRKMVLLK